MVVLAGMVDVQVGVQHITDIAEFDPVFRQLVLDHIVVELQTAHAQRFHDRIVPIPGINNNRIGAAQNQVAIDGNPFDPAAIVPENQKTVFQFDVAIVQNLDLKCHSLSPFSVRSGARNSVP